MQKSTNSSHLIDIDSGDIVTCTIGNTSLSGVYVTERNGMAVIKLNSGYNIGVAPSDCSVQQKSTGEPAKVTHEHEVEQDTSLPLISIISTGGTIASSVDYRTGAVTSKYEVKEILALIPGLTQMAHFRSIHLLNILSENMTVTIWQKMAQAVYDEIQAGAKGIIITHGTDTMAYSAAALSFMLKTTVPIVFVGSQRSADRPSSDNVMNMLCATKVALEGPKEVMIVMHASSSDDKCAIHRGVRVRKMHTSCRDAFQSIGTPPLGYVSYPELEITLSKPIPSSPAQECELSSDMEETCGLVYYYPGASPNLLDAFQNYKGLIIAGTGLGHCSTEWVLRLAEMCRSGITVVMVSQCLKGNVCDRVYDTGRDLLAAGVIEGGDMLPEVALVKLMWVLAHASSHDEVVDMMQKTLAFEKNQSSLVAWRCAE
jgi:glutamyl-tRNA(Gln) amidotransferase subunit D